jgi:hypothetical protein
VALGGSADHLRRSSPRSQLPHQIASYSDEIGTGSKDTINDKDNFGFSNAILADLPKLHTSFEQLN